MNGNPLSIVCLCVCVCVWGEGYILVMCVCDLFSTLAVVIVLDLSKPELMWDTLEVLLKEVRPSLKAS